MQRLVGTGRPEVSVDGPALRRLLRRQDRRALTIAKRQRRRRAALLAQVLRNVNALLADSARVLCLCPARADWTASARRSRGRLAAPSDAGLGEEQHSCSATLTTTTPTRMSSTASGRLADPAGAAPRVALAGRQRPDSVFIRRPASPQREPPDDETRRADRDHAGRTAAGGATSRLIRSRAPARR